MKVLVREFPTGSFNAHAHRVSGGALLLVNTGLFKFLHKATKLMMPLMEAVKLDAKHHYQGSLVDAHFSESLGGREISRDQTLDFFSELVFAYLLGDFSYARRLPSSGGPRGIASSRLLWSVELFAIAHEYGHVLAGHISGSSTRFARTPVGSVALVEKSWIQEFEADHIGCQTLFWALNTNQNERHEASRDDIIFALAGPVVFLALDRLVSGFEHDLTKHGLAPSPDETHPPAQQRSETLRQLFKKMAPVSDDLQIGSLSIGCEWFLSEVGRGIRDQFNDNPEGWLRRRIDNVLKLQGFG
jgi:hypothetical protein